VRYRRNVFAALAIAGSIFAMTNATAGAHDPNTPEGQAAIQEFMADYQQPDRSAPITGTAAGVPCVNGKADQYPCKNVDLMSYLPMSTIGGGNGNDIWGWTDPTNNKEYALVGRSNGTSFVDVTNPTAPVYLGNLPTNGGTSSWRDIDVYANHAFIVADFVTGHGMQVFDLTRLRTVTSPQTFTADKIYTGFGPAHTITVNPASGFVYANGSNTCSGGSHMVDVRTPKNPINAGCVSQDGYVHDNHCVTYDGPDAAYRGREICVNSNEDTVTTVDVTDKANPRQLSRISYTGAKYVHQGWFTEGKRYFLLDDELDHEGAADKRAKTYVFDMLSLAAPKHIGTYTSSVEATDHQMFVVGKHAFQSNYRSGLRILDVTNVANGSLTEAGFFDMYPSSDGVGFNGTWANYPFFKSGNIIVNGIEQGLFVVKPNLGGDLPPRSYENPNNVNIPDAGAAVTSDISVTGLDGAAPATTKVDVDIKHSWRGDLVIDLVAPDGSLYRLKNSSGNDSADNVIATYTVDVSSELLKGTWKLKVQDVARYDTGYIDNFRITF
jgi:choice-of-anchor B domain-containing protein